jgi:hypothetical protein
MNIGDSGGVATDHLYLDSDSRAALTEETAELYANTITVDNGAELALGLGQVDTHNGSDRWRRAERCQPRLRAEQRSEQRTLYH